MTAQTTTQRTAKHRLAVKERMARYEAALQAIVEMGKDQGEFYRSNFRIGECVGMEKAAAVAFRALAPTTTPKTP